MDLLIWLLFDGVGDFIEGVAGAASLCVVSSSIIYRDDFRTLAIGFSFWAFFAGFCFIGRLALNCGEKTRYGAAGTLVSNSLLNRVP
jgi:hypothetical protein